MADQQFQTRARLRKARGQERPAYLEPGDLDRVFIMMTSLMTELSALRDRVDTHEALAERGTVATTDAVERFELDAERRTTREARRDELLGRVLRVIYEDRDG